MSVLVCFALKEEAAPFGKIAARRPGVHPLVVGIGRANAEKSVRDFLGSAPAPGATGDAPVAGIRHEGVPNRSRGGCTPQLVLTCGFAGGLNPELKLGDVVFDVQSPKSKVQSELLAAGAKPAKFFCADRIATTVAEKKLLRAQTGADAVEMESAAIHAVCAEKNIPCVTVRVVSDTAHEDLPLDFNALAKADRSIDFGKLLLAIAKSPKKIPQLLALQKKTSFAATQLAEVLAKIL